MPMQGGSGDDSYVHNSQLQNYNFHAFAKPHLAHTLDAYINIEELTPGPCAPGTGTFRIADFGCSCGRNALDYAKFVVAQLHEKYQLQMGAYAGAQYGDVQLPEIQYFFSDLPSNDFNNLFQTLEFVRNLDLHTAADPNAVSSAHISGFPEFHAAAVPGSFYGRLFPKGSLNLALSSYSLHWLSQVPSSVIDKTSPAWNGGHVWIHGDRPAVFQAYAHQFHVDMKNFLRYRAEELEKGGIMFLFSLCRADEQPKGAYVHHCNDTWCGYFESTWDEMVYDGLISVDARDMFNVPVYMFSRGEFEAALREVPELELLKMKVMEDRNNLPEPELQRLLADPQAFGRYWVGFIKSLVKPLVEAHIGEERADEFFKRLQRISTEKAHLTKSMAYDLLVAVLLRT